MLRRFCGFDFQYPFYRLPFGITRNAVFPLAPLTGIFIFLKGRKGFLFLGYTVSFSHLKLTQSQKKIVVMKSDFSLPICSFFVLLQL